MPEIVWLPEALDDLARLLDFLAKENPDAARKAAGAISRGTKLLLSAPAIGRAMREPPARREFAISFGASAYILRYRNDEAGRIVIIRVWHGREARL